MDECTSEGWDNAMTLKGIIDEDCINYKKKSMILEFPYCSFKCNKEYGQQVCQNSTLAAMPNIKISTIKLVQRYLNNNITQAIICQGLEPMDSFEELLDFIRTLRLMGNNDDIVIYTGYNKDEITDKIELLKNFNNIIIKFGRYIPNQQPHYDEVLGVNLASDNQYAERISES